MTNWRSILTDPLPLDDFGKAQMMCRERALLAFDGSLWSQTSIKRNLRGEGPEYHERVAARSAGRRASILQPPQIISLERLPPDAIYAVDLAGMAGVDAYGTRLSDDVIRAFKEQIEAIPGGVSAGSPVSFHTSWRAEDAYNRRQSEARARE